MDKGRVLYYLERWSSGGIEAFITNVLVSTHASGNAPGADIVAHCVEESIFTEKLAEIGVRIFELSGSLRAPKNAKLFRRFIRERKYTAIHFNVFHGLGLKFAQIARKEGADVRIVHCHGAGLGDGFAAKIKTALSRIGVSLWLREATKRIACSDAAGKFLFGNKDFTVIPNGINSERFAFSEEKRIIIRSKLSLGDSTVVGHIGRFSSEKNHEFLLRSFAKAKNFIPDSKLLLLGEGELLDDMRSLAIELGIERDVVFQGAVSHPEDYLCAMDVFMLPSVFEGFGIAAIEAQASGLPVILSDGVPRSVAISDKAIFLPLDSEEEWARSAKTLAERKSDRHGAEKAIHEHGFDVSETAKKINRLYSNGEYKISVIVPIYNLEGCVEKTLSALLSQTHENIEIIAVDDGSRDGSAQIIQRMADADSRIKPIFKQNGGASDARNAGLAIADGDYIGFVDGDDIPELDMYEYLLKGALKHDADTVQCGMIENGKIVVTPKKDVVTSSPLKCKKYIKNFSGGSCCKLYKRELIEGLRFPLGYKVGEDMYFNIAAVCRSKRAALLCEAKYNYVRRGDSATSTQNLTDYSNALKKCSEDFGENRAARRFLKAEAFKTFADVASKITLGAVAPDSMLKDIRRKIRRGTFGVLFSTRLTLKMKAKLMLLAYFPTIYKKSVIKAHTPAE